MRMLTRFALALVLASGLAACGDDDDSASDATEDTSSDDSGSDDSGDSGDSDSGGDSGGGGFAGEGCAEFAAAFADAGAALGGTGSGDLGEVAAFFEEAAEEAPDEVADALQVYAEAYGEFAAALEEAGFDPNDPNAISDPEAAAVFAEAGEAFSSEEFTEASETIAQFTNNNCEG